MSVDLHSPLVDKALADTADSVFWLDRPGAPEPTAPLVGAEAADLVVVGGGLTGLWTAIEAKRADPSRDVLILEAGAVASGASGRNGGFISESLTHGLAHGEACWPEEMETLLRLGRENMAEIAAFLHEQGVDARLRQLGKSVLAVTPQQAGHLQGIAELCDRYGEEAELLDQDAARADVDSPTYLGAVRVHTGSGTVDPAALCWGLLGIARRLGVRLHEGSAVTGIERIGGSGGSAAGVLLRTAAGSVRAGGAVLATNAFPPLLRRLRSFILPVLDHVLVTEPLTPEQRESIGWKAEQGLTDAGNQFHYYRLTPDGRILFGGYDATYHFGGATPDGVPAREESYRRLAAHFHDTFPQLAGIRFSHRWFGVIDTTSRFTPVFGTAHGGRVAYAVGYTGLGVGFSRFGARVALDLLDGKPTERTALTLVSRPPVPFPPEPLRYPIVQATKAALAKEDRTGRRGVFLGLLDRLGVGFNS